RGSAESGVDDRQRKQDVLAGVGGVMLLEDQLGRHDACHHAVLDDGTLGAWVTLRCPTAHNGVAEEAALPQLDRLLSDLPVAAALAEHEQQVGWPERRRYQVFGRDAGDVFVSHCRERGTPVPLM